MGKKNNHIGRKAWGLLRLALLWARKGGVFKRRLMMELRTSVSKHIKTLQIHHTHTNATTPRIQYGERELSFDKTPSSSHLKMGSMRFLIPCITGSDVDFDYDFGDLKSFLRNGEEEQQQEEKEKDTEFEEEKDVEDEAKDEDEDEDEEEIDARAEKFIASFYEEIKLQRQVSYLEYNEMISRGTY